jgi:hypothetical protein
MHWEHWKHCSIAALNALLKFLIWALFIHNKPFFVDYCGSVFNIHSGYVLRDMALRFGPDTLISYIHIYI